MFNSKNTTIVCTDVQQRLVDAMKNANMIKNNTVKMMKIASILNVDTIITEQYPQGLGSTIDEITEIKVFKTVEKTSFSSWDCPNFRKEFKKFRNKNVLIFGLETHICVFQTAHDLIEKGYNVFVIADCCASRSELNYIAALETLKEMGAKVITLEMVLFEFLKSSKHPDFKEIQGLIK